MIARKNRFHGHSSLKYVYQHGKTVRGTLFSLRATENPKRDTYRAAVVVSRKISKLAVKRNRMRRRLYETIRLAAPEFTGAHDIVVTVFSDKVLETPHDKLAHEMRAQLAKAGILPVKSRV